MNAFKFIMLFANFEKGCVSTNYSVCKENLEKPEKAGKLQR
jgi:hypothetical protein